MLGSSILAGLVVYANYWSCDPKAEGIIDKTDEIAPLFVMQHLVKFYGVPGVFVAALLGAALRSVRLLRPLHCIGGAAARRLSPISFPVTSLYCPKRLLSDPSRLSFDLELEMDEKKHA